MFQMSTLPKVIFFLCSCFSDWIRIRKNVIYPAGFANTEFSVVFAYIKRNCENLIRKFQPCQLETSVIFNNCYEIRTLFLFKRVYRPIVGVRLVTGQEQNPGKNFLQCRGRVPTRVDRSRTLATTFYSVGGSRQIVVSSRLGRIAGRGGVGRSRTLARTFNSVGGSRQIVVCRR